MRMRMRMNWLTGGNGKLEDTDKTPLNSLNPLDRQTAGIVDGLRVWSWASFDAAKVDELVVVFFCTGLVQTRDMTDFFVMCFCFFLIFRLALLFGVFLE